MIRNLFLAVALLLPAVAQAQLAFWIPTSGDSGIGIAIGSDGKVVAFTRLVTVQPGPGPNPPAPIVVTAPWILITEETSARDKLTPGQREIILGTGPGSVREWAATNCGKEGTVPAFKVLDKDTPVDKLSPTWKEMTARPRQSLPWLEVMTPKGGFEGPLPATAAECLAILNKLKGA